MMYTNEHTYSEMTEILNDLQDRHSLINIGYIGKSVFERPIPIVTLGDKNARKSVLYVATHHASENICTTLLLNFINDYFEAYERFAQMYQINLRYLYKMRKIYVIPMLNPDGVEYRLRGIDNDNPIKDRIISYNGGDDFTKWNANARGVDLNHNYDAYFDEYKQIEKEQGIKNGKSRYSGEYPESEPEVASLTNFIRYNSDEIEGILTLHTQGEEIYYKSKGSCTSKSEYIGKLISKMTGYRMAEAQGESACGGLTDWFIKEYQKPSFTMECGRGENPLPREQIVDIYTRLKELFFTFPILF